MVRWLRYFSMRFSGAPAAVCGLLNRLARAVTVFALPAWGFREAGNPRLARHSLAAYGVCLLFVIVFLGQIGATLAGGLLIAIHVVGILYYAIRRELMKGIPARVVGIVVILAALILVIYLPAMNLLSNLVFPVRTENGAIVINTRYPLEKIQRGDWVGYRIVGQSGGGAILREGLAYEPVLGVAGDVIRFGGEEFEVNGISRPSLRDMPVTGELTVPEGHFYIWTSSFRGQTNHGAINLQRSAALVPESAILGKGFERWFFRRQA